MLKKKTGMSTKTGKENNQIQNVKKLSILN